MFTYLLISSWVVLFSEECSSNVGGGRGRETSMGKFDNYANSTIPLPHRIHDRFEGELCAGDRNRLFLFWRSFSRTSLYEFCHPIGGKQQGRALPDSAAINPTIDVVPVHKGLISCALNQQIMSTQCAEYPSILRSEE